MLQRTQASLFDIELPKVHKINYKLIRPNLFNIFLNAIHTNINFTQITTEIINVFGSNTKDYIDQFKHDFKTGKIPLNKTSYLFKNKVINEILKDNFYAFKVKKILFNLLTNYHQPSASEIISTVENSIALEARWHIIEALDFLKTFEYLNNQQKTYLHDILKSNSIQRVLSGIKNERNKEVNTGIDQLILQSKQYRKSAQFSKMIQFMSKFRHYSPYNNMLIWLQNPSCSFYATRTDWKNRFNRNLLEDARPMLILAPMHPVMLVYDLDQTEGDKLPEEILNFSKFEGKWKDGWLEKIIENAYMYLIRIDFINLSSTNSGFATFSKPADNMKMRIAIDKSLDDKSRFGVICHELAHIFLGHLGSDKDMWWRSRASLTHHTMEIEAETVAFIATGHLGMEGHSAQYISRHLEGNGDIPATVSIDTIAKVSGKIKKMALGKLPEPKRKKRD